MQLRVRGFTEIRTSGRQQFISRNRMAALTKAEGNLFVPGFSTCCDGCSSCSSGW